MNPDRVWVMRAKERLMGQIGNTVEKEAGFSWNNLHKVIGQAFTIFIPQTVMQIARPVFVFLLVGAITMSGWIASVNATQNCLPGEVCYGVKLAMEKTQVLVATVTGSSNETKAQLHMEFANRRAQEAKKVVDKKESDSNQKATVAIQHLKDSLKSADGVVQDAGKSEPENAVEMAKDVNEKTEKIVETLKEVSKETTVNTALAKEVGEGAKMANDTGIKAIEMAIQKQADGSADVTKESVKNLVEGKINTILQQTENTKAAAQEVKSISASASSTGALLAVTSSTTITTVINSVTIQTTSTVSTEMKTAVEQVVQKVNENNETAKKVAEEAKDLVANNQLMEAVKKVKEGNEVVNQAQQGVAQATQMMKDAMPTAPVAVPAPLVAPSVTTTPSSQTNTSPQVKAVHQPAVISTSTEKK